MTYRPDPKSLPRMQPFTTRLRRAFPSVSRFLNKRSAERVGRRSRPAGLGSAFLPVRAAARQSHGAAGASLSRPPVSMYNPDIGDGRGFTFAQLRDDRDRLRDLGTKGSGETTYSRYADGRLTLKGGVRELLATEMLEALGVNTSKSFALFETGEQLERGDEPSPTRSSVLTRLSHGHIRIGTFQRSPSSARSKTSTNSSAIASRICMPSQWSDDAANALRLFDLVSRRPPRSPPPISPPDSSTACSTATISTSPAKASITARGASPRVGSGLHRRLFRSLRSLCVRPPARGDPLGPRAIRRMPQPGRRSPAPVRNARRVERTVRGSACSSDAPAARSRSARRERDRELAAALITALSSREATIDRIFFDWRGGRDPGAERYPSDPFRALAKALEGRERRHRIHIGPILRPARCTSTRSRRSGRRSPNATTGSRSTTRLMPSAEWARRWSGCAGSLTKAGRWSARGGGQHPDLVRPGDRRAKSGRARSATRPPRSPPRAPPGRPGRRIRSPTASRPCAASPMSCASARASSPS